MSLDGIPSPPPAPTALTDARGRYRLPSAAGLARLQITKPGFTAAERVVQAVAGRARAAAGCAPDPLDPNATVITGILGGTATDASGERVLFVPPGALAGDQALQITPVDGQSLIQSLPAGLNIAPLTVNYPTATLEFVGSSVGGWLLPPPGSGAIA